MFGLLAPNGAGKSTLMRTIATLQRPDAGRHPQTPRLLAIGDAADMTVDFVVSGLPRKTGVDPFNKLIDRTLEDNVRPVDVVAKN